MEIRSEVKSLLPELLEVRHDIHRHPELGFEEHRTQALVRDWLEARGFKPRDCADTGLIADLHPEGRTGPTIALRADLDCLPIQEETDLPYRSIHAGRSHKCGHDGHTTILMGVAALLAEQRERIQGNVRLLFQPAEEGVRGGGAKVMVAEGALDGVQEVYGLHNWPAWPKGELRVDAGPVMAQADLFEIIVRGVGGHGSQPQLCRDPIAAAAHMVTALQTVVSRGVGSAGGAVLSVCEFHAGTAANIIPDTTRLSGTIRTFAESTRTRVLERFEEVLEGTRRSFGVNVELDFRPGYPVLVNDAGCAEVVARVGERLLGAEKVSPDDLPMAGGEDFAYFARERPAAYFFLGAKKPGEETPVCHHPDFDFEDELIPVGIQMFLGIVEDRMRELSP
jgi:amidohydrolase